MSTITLRSVKGSGLTNNEVDANFSNLNSDKTEKSANLSDLTSAPTARSNINVYSVQETDSLLAGKLSTANGAVGTNNLADGAVTSAKLAPGAGGATCRAWVNFNGTGTVAIRAAFNVSSITDNGTPDYTVNFTTAMPDANYSVNGGSSIWDSNHFNQTVGTRLASASSFVTKTVSSVRVSGPSNSTYDPFDVNVVIFR